MRKSIDSEVDVNTISTNKQTNKQTWHKNGTATV